MTTAKPICVGCQKPPTELAEYCERYWEIPPDVTVKDDGTYNPDNGHFWCTACFVNEKCPPGVAP